jgi:hypothetical protein
MTLNEEVAWLKKELIHERKRVKQARTVALDLADILSEFMRDGIPLDLEEVFEKWRIQESKRR